MVIVNPIRFIWKPKPKPERIVYDLDRGEAYVEGKYPRTAPNPIIPGSRINLPASDGTEKPSSPTPPSRSGGGGSGGRSSASNLRGSAGGGMDSKKEVTQINQQTREQITQEKLRQQQLGPNRETYEQQKALRERILREGEVQAYNRTRWEKIKDLPSKAFEKVTGRKPREAFRFITGSSETDVTKPLTAKEVVFESTQVPIRGTNIFFSLAGKGVEEGLESTGYEGITINQKPTEEKTITIREPQFGSISSEAPSGYIETDIIIPARGQRTTKILTPEKIGESVSFGGTLGATIAQPMFFAPGFITEGVKTATDKDATILQRAGGVLEAGTGAFIIGKPIYNAGRGYLTNPQIRRVQVGRQSFVKTSAIGDDITFVSDEGAFNKVVFPEQKLSQTFIPGSRAEVTTRWNNIFDNKIRISKGSTPNKVKFEWIKANPIYKGVTYADREGYNRAIKLLIKQGYTKPQAQKILRYTAPQQIDESLSGFLNVDNQQAVGQFQSTQNKIVKTIDESLKIKTRGGQSVVDVYDVERFGTNKGNVGIFGEGTIRTRKFLKNGKLQSIESGEASIGAGVTLQTIDIPGYKVQRYGNLIEIEEAPYKDIFSFAGKKDIYPYSKKIIPNMQKTTIFKSLVEAPRKDIGFKGGGRKSSKQFLEQLYSQETDALKVAPQIKSSLKTPKPSAKIETPKPSQEMFPLVSASSGLSSVYAGTGQYERTTPLMSIQSEPQAMGSDLNLGLVSSQKIDLTPKVTSKPESLIKIDTLPKEETSSGQRRDTLSDTSSRQDSDTIQELTTSSSQLISNQPSLKTSSTTSKPNNVFETKQNLFFSRPISESRRKSSGEKETKSVRGWIAEVKEFGKWKAINPDKPLKKKEAEKLAKFVTDETLTASARIKPSNKFAVMDTIRRIARNEKFRDYKISRGKRIPQKDLWIEKRKYRLDRPKETLTLQQFKKTASYKSAWKSPKVSNKRILKKSQATLTINKPRTFKGNNLFFKS